MLIKAAPVLILLIIMVALTCVSMTVEFDGVTYTQTSPPTPVPTAVPLPSSADCANVGVDYPANPFRGSPINPINWGLVSAYYCSASYFANFGYDHFGVDLAYGLGTPVHATGAGSVTSAGNHALMGLHVIVCTPTNWCTVYMHLSALDVAPFWTVSDGQKIGEVGTTGNSTGYHLHYEVRQPDGVRIDPLPAMQ